MDRLKNWYKNISSGKKAALVLIVFCVVVIAVMGIEKIYNKLDVVKIDNVVERPYIANPESTILDDWNKLDLNMSVKEISDIIGFTPTEENFNMFPDATAQYFVWSYDGIKQWQQYYASSEGYAILLVVDHKKNKQLDLRIPNVGVSDSKVTQ